MIFEIKGTGERIYFPDDMDKKQVGEAIARHVFNQKSPKEKKSFLENMKSNLDQMVGAGEVALTVGSGIVNEIEAGYRGILSGATKLMMDATDPEKEVNLDEVIGHATRMINETRNRGAYMPRTETGQRYLENVGEALMPVAEGLESVSRQTGDFYYDKTGSELAGAIGYTAPTALLELIGLRGARSLARQGRLGTQYEIGDVGNANRISNKQAGMYGGIRAKNADLDALERAKEMSAQGASREEIMYATGWFQPPDGKWRFEFPDDQARFRENLGVYKDAEMAKMRTPYDDAVSIGNSAIAKLRKMYQNDNKFRPELLDRNEARYVDDIMSVNMSMLSKEPTAREVQGLLYESVDNATNMQKQSRERRFRPALGDVLEHPLLFENYPEAAGWPMKIGSDNSPNAPGGSWNPRTNEIYINLAKNDMPPPVPGAPGPSSQGLSTTLHEVMHGIQGAEGFTPGGAPGSAYLVTQGDRSKVYTQDAPQMTREQDLASRRQVLEDTEEIRRLGIVEKDDDLIEIASGNRKVKPSYLTNMSDWYRYSDEIRSLYGIQPKKAGPERDQWIQNVAGFMANKHAERVGNGDVARGADMIANLRNYYDKTPKQVKSRRNYLARKRDKFDQGNARINNRDIEIERYDRMKPYDQYRRIYGEGEARNVQWRQRLNESERKNVYPWESFDIDESEFISFDGNAPGWTGALQGEQMSLDDPSTIARMYQLGMVTDPNKINKAAITKYNKLMQNDPGFRHREELAQANNFETIATRERPEINMITPEALQGSAIALLSGDRSDIGNISRIGGIDLDNPMDLHGGYGYALRNEGDWASEIGAAKPKKEQYNAISRLTGGRPVVAMYGAMAPDSTDFSTHVVDAMYRQLPSLKLDPKKVKQFDEQFAKIYKGGEWPGLMNPQSYQDLMTGSGKDRTRFARMMKMADYRDSGFPSYRNITDDVNAPELEGLPAYAMGKVVTQPRLGDPMEILTPDAQHPSYEYRMPADLLGGLPVSLPIEDMMPRALASQLGRETNFKKKDGTISKRPFTMDLAMGALKSLRDPEKGLFYEIADQEWVDNIMPKYEAALAAQPVEVPGRPMPRVPEITTADALGGKIQGQPGSATTQVATTVNSYRKAVGKVDNPGEVLDYGAGMGLGADSMREVDGVKSVDTYEPFPGRWKGKKPVDYTDNLQIKKKYDTVVNLNVLNVLEPERRTEVLTDMLTHLKPGGQAIISTRKFKGDVAGAKHFREADEHNAIWVKKGDQWVYQRGFDGNELVDYVQEVAGPDYRVIKDNSFGAAGVRVIKND